MCPKTWFLCPSFYSDYCETYTIISSLVPVCVRVSEPFSASDTCETPSLWALRSSCVRVSVLLYVVSRLEILGARGAHLYAYIRYVYARAFRRTHGHSGRGAC